MSTYYRMTVQRIERDPDYEAKRAEWMRNNPPYSRQFEDSGPTRDVFAGDALTCEITADEFKALRNSVVEIWNM